MKIKALKIQKILKFKNNDYKYLSPYIYKINNYYQLLYSNRKSRIKFTGQIESAKSSDLIKWTRNNKPYLVPSFKSKYISFVSPNIGIINNKKILFIEAQNYKYHSDIISFHLVKKKWTLFSKFKLKNFRDNYQSPFFFKYKNKNLLFYSKNGKSIECIELDKNFKIIKKNICLRSELINEKFSIYAPSIIMINNNLHMFYAAWKNKLEGNINYAYSLDGMNWVKKYRNIFKFKRNIKIISEPFFIKKANKTFLFFEFKQKNNQWNISSKLISKNFFANN